MIFRVEHFVCAGKTCLLDSVLVELSNLDDTLEHIGFLFRVRLMKHTLVALACCARLACVNSRNDENFVLNFFLNLGKSVDIFKNRLRLVGRARTDDKNELVAFTLKDLFDFLISDFFFAVASSESGYCALISFGTGSFLMNFVFFILSILFTSQNFYSLL